MIGILLMSYGSPRSINDVGNYFSHILNGRTPPPHMLERVASQFKALVTADPLSSTTLRQATALEWLLKASQKDNVKVYAGFKHAPPYIEDTVQRMVDDGASEIVSLPLTPIYSDTGVGVYHDAVRKALEDKGSQIRVREITHWHLHGGYIAALADRVKTAYEWLSEDARTQSAVIFTTHSKPGTPEKNRAYCDAFCAMALKISEWLGVANWRLAYRGARSPQEWLSPDVKDVIREEAAKGHKGFVLCDLLTITANLEVMNEIGEDCKKLAESLGVELVRAQFLGDSADFMFALADIIKDHLAKNF